MAAAASSVQVSCILLAYPHTSTDDAHYMLICGQNKNLRIDAYQTYVACITRHERLYIPQI